LCNWQALISPLFIYCVISLLWPVFCLSRGFFFYPIRICLLATRNNHTSILLFTLSVVLLSIISPFILQSDEDCCNSCEEVREAYQKKGWAVTNPDLMDQVI
jgi:hypothetical protein